MPDIWTIIPPAALGGVFDEAIYDETVFECGGWAGLAPADGVWTEQAAAGGNWTEV